MPFRSFYNLFHIDDSRDLCLHPACSPSFLWCPLGHFLSALLLLPEATCECGGSFPPGTALQFPKVPHQTQSYLQGSFPPSGLLPTSWLRKEVLGEALAACYSLFILSNLQIRISILVHTENDLPSFLSFCIRSHCSFFPLEQAWLGSTRVAAHPGLSGLRPGGCWEGERPGHLEAG